MMVVVKDGAKNLKKMNTGRCIYNRVLKEKGVKNMAMKERSHKCI